MGIPFLVLGGGMEESPFYLYQINQFRDGHCGLIDEMGRGRGGRASSAGGLIFLSERSLILCGRADPAPHEELGREKKLFFDPGGGRSRERKRLLSLSHLSTG